MIIFAETGEKAESHFKTKPPPGDDIKDRGEPGRVKHKTPNQPDRTARRVAGLPNPQFPSVARPEWHPQDVGKLSTWEHPVQIGQHGAELCRARRQGSPYNHPFRAQPTGICFCFGHSASQRT